MSDENALKIDSNENGFSVWSGMKWVIDASTLNSDGEISVDLSKFDLDFSTQEGKMTLRLK